MFPTRPMVRLALVAMLVSSATVAMAWGPRGHRVIARVALDRLTPEAKRAVKELLHPDDTLPDIADWADHEGHDVYPDSSSWHFVNIPIKAEHYRDGADARRSTNVVHQIEKARATLLDRSKPKVDRQTALLFLVHFVADLHQPLHVGDNSDRGGNQTQVRFDGQGTNLHQLWDSGLIRHIGGNEAAWVRRVEGEITVDRARAWGKGGPDEWADESLQAAKVAYQDLKGAPRSVEAGYALGDAYVKQVEPIVVDRLARASVRLADELNGIFRDR